MTPNELNTYYNLAAPAEDWESMLRKIPPEILVRMARGPPPISGWVASEIVPTDDSEGESDSDTESDSDHNNRIQIGDIYFSYHTKPEGCNPPQTNRLQHFLPDPGEGANPTDHSEHSISWASQASSNDDDWATDWAPELSSLRAVAVSAISGKPRVLGWGDSTPHMMHFRPPGPDKPLEREIAASFYHTLCGDPEQTVDVYFKPSFTTINKAVRGQLSSPLPELQQWQPNADDINAHQELIDQGRAKPGSPCTLNWKEIFKLLWNCVFIQPKYKQLLYWIITNTSHTCRHLCEPLGSRKGQLSHMPETCI